MGSPAGRNADEAGRAIRERRRAHARALSEGVRPIVWSAESPCRTGGGSVLRVDGTACRAFDPGGACRVTPRIQGGVPVLWHTRKNLNHTLGPAPPTRPVSDRRYLSPSSICNYASPRRIQPIVLESNRAVYVMSSKVYLILENGRAFSWIRNSGREPARVPGRMKGEAVAVRDIPPERAVRRNKRERIVLKGSRG